MAPKFIYRAFHEVHSAGSNSQGGFKSVLQHSDPVPSDTITLQAHSDTHSDADAVGRSPSPWITTTDQLLRAILLAIQIANVHGIAGVHIAIIDVSKCTAYPPRKTRDLRYQHRLGYDPEHNFEFLCKWEIPRSAIVSSLSLPTMRDRGLFRMVPQVLDFADVDECLVGIFDDWEVARSRDRYLQQVGVKAAELAYVFGLGVHTEYVGLEAARWWELRVGRPGWKSGYGRYFFRTFNATLRGGTDNPCFEETVSD